MLHTKQKGTISELRVTAALISAGYIVSIPAGDYCRYDALIDNGTSISKVQFKTGRYRKGAVTFNTSSNDYSKPGNTKDYHGEVDFFGVFCPDINECFLVPIEEIGTQKMKSLRLDPAKNNQITKTSIASDFVIKSTTYH